MRFEMKGLEAEVAKKFFPEHIINRLNEEGIETVAAIDENTGEIVGAAAFYCSDSMAVYAVLLYIYIANEYRTVENGINLVGYALDIFAVRGVKIVHWDLRVSEEDGTRGKFIEQNGFILTNKHGYLLAYNMASLQNSLFASKINEMDALISRVSSFDDLREEQLLEFRRKAKLEEHEVYIDGLDSRYACFYLENDIIKAYYDLRETAKGTIYMTDSYVLSDCNKKHALPAMIGKFIKNSKQFSDNESKVVFPIFTAEEYNGIKSVFGQPQFEERVNVYKKDI